MLGFFLLARQTFSALVCPSECYLFHGLLKMLKLLIFLPLCSQLVCKYLYYMCAHIIEQAKENQPEIKFKQSKLSLNLFAWQTAVINPNVEWMSSTQSIQNKTLFLWPTKILFDISLWDGLENFFTFTGNERKEPNASKLSYPLINNRRAFSWLYESNNRDICCVILIWLRGPCIDIQREIFFVSMLNGKIEKNSSLYFVC